MQCPRCGNSLATVRAGSLETDICQSCAGIWFDRFELNKVDETHELLGEFLLDELVPRDRLLVATSSRLRCPRDTDVVMMRRRFSPEQPIMIDECPACGGVWLDADELSAIRSLSES
jgi:Zn-finger nucleic acid-binding protein